MVENPYSILPQDVADLESITLLDDRMSVHIGSLFDACYEILMQVLSRLLMHTEESESQLVLLANVSIDMMTGVILPLGEALTSLPAGKSNPGMTAGPSFRFTRDGDSRVHGPGPRPH